MFGRVPGTRPNISESHSETSTRVPFCIAGSQHQGGRGRTPRREGRPPRRPQSWRARTRELNQLRVIGAIHAARTRRLNCSDPRPTEQCVLKAVCFKSLSTLRLKPQAGVRTQYVWYPPGILNWPYHTINSSKNDCGFSLSVYKASAVSTETHEVWRQSARALRTQCVRDPGSTTAGLPFFISPKITGGGGGVKFPTSPLSTFWFSSYHLSVWGRYVDQTFRAAQR